MSRSTVNGSPPPRRVGRPGRLLALLAALALIGPATAVAQESDDCTLLCEPELEIEPGVAIEPIFRSPRVAELEDGVAVDTSRETTAAEFELTLAVGIPTEIPRTELGFDVTWTPCVETDENPFTGRTGQSFRENVIEFAPEVSVTLLTPRRRADGPRSPWPPLTTSAPPRRRTRAASSPTSWNSRSRRRWFRSGSFPRTTGFGTWSWRAPSTTWPPAT